jgi:hypothetical protein
MADRLGTTYDGQVCSRCNGFVTSSGAGVVTCVCSDEQLSQFAAESHLDQQLVAKMLFSHRMADDANLPVQKRIAYTEELKELYNENRQLAIRNNVKSPFALTQ